MKAAEFVATKVTESVKTCKGRDLEAVKRKYSIAMYDHISIDFESPDAIDLNDD